MADTEGQPASGEESRAQETNEQTNKPQEVAEWQPKADTPDEGDAKKPEGDKPEGEGGGKDKPKEPEKPKRNRTGEYIHKLQSRINDLTKALEEQRNPKPATTDAGPTLEQSNFDQAAYADARAKWAAESAVNSYKQQAQQEAAQRQITEITDGYNAKVQSFAAEHPDFAQKVAAIPYVPSDAVQLAIMAHEQGPEVSYAIANDDDLAFQLASIQPHLAAAAVDRIASRLAAAQEAPQPTQPVNARPVSQAPPPVQTVSGKTPTKTPDEKLTDAEWWERERKKRAS
jgi:hypothetical protein